jgi:hypothetical protein
MAVAESSLAQFSVTLRTNSGSLAIFAAIRRALSGMFVFPFALDDPDYSFELIGIEIGIGDANVKRQTRF